MIWRRSISPLRRPFAHLVQSFERFQFCEKYLLFKLLEGKDKPGKIGTLLATCMLTMMKVIMMTKMLTIMRPNVDKDVDNNEKPNETKILAIMRNLMLTKMTTTTRWRRKLRRDWLLPPPPKRGRVAVPHLQQRSKQDMQRNQKSALAYILPWKKNITNLHQKQRQN